MLISTGLFHSRPELYSHVDKYCGIWLLRHLISPSPMSPSHFLCSKQIDSSQSVVILFIDPHLSLTYSYSCFERKGFLYKNTTNVEIRMDETGTSDFSCSFNVFVGMTLAVDNILSYILVFWSLSCISMYRKAGNISFLCGLTAFLLPCSLD